MPDTKGKLKGENLDDATGFCDGIETVVKQVESLGLQSVFARRCGEAFGRGFW